VIRVAAILVLSSVAAAAPVRVGPGVYRPVFPASDGEREVAVVAFRLDRTQVTNAEFLAFVRTHPEWRRDRVRPLVADDRYLSHWKTPDALGSARPDAPVIRVSWFAARAFCAARGGRLPVEKEWELAAAASATSRDASRDPAFQDRILAWYAELAPATLPAVGRTTNAWGVSDLHGLVWEWIEDYSGALVGADSRSGGTFCGGASARSSDPAGYATFLRFAFRSSLEGRSTTAVLGFRCAYDEVRR
jgi:formylglycine-generating enzyme